MACPCDVSVQITGPASTNKYIYIQSWDNSTNEQVYVSASALHINTMANHDIRLYSPTNSAGVSVFTIESNFPFQWTRIWDVRADGSFYVRGRQVLNASGQALYA